ncbi:MAG: DUF1501 domain-containing protein [Pseudomonadota bacterium]
MKRRAFFSGAAATLAAGAHLGQAGVGMGTLGIPAARAADTSGYKALVCLFFLGGMDHADTLIPFDNPSYSALATLRPGLFNAYGVGSGTSSRDRENLLVLSPDNASALGGRRFGLPENMAPLRRMFNDGDLAFVGSVGPIITPTTRDDFEARRVPLPPQLFSHNDQQSVWQTFGPEGTTLGWGGRFVDAMLRADPGIDPRFAAITTASNAPFLSGETAPAFTISPRGRNGLDLTSRTFFLGNDAGIDQVRARIDDYYGRLNWDNRNIFQRDYGRLQGEGVQSGAFFSAAYDGTEELSTFPSSRLGDQLEAIARTIGINGSLGAQRQIFFVGLGGFDTHSGQASSLPRLQGEIADALFAFRTAMIDMGMWNNVTVFSASDFGRTLIDNGDGTDHAWASHHFVAGGDVAGRSIFGTMPSLDIQGEDYTEDSGRLIPAHSVDQYAATLGRWFGLGEDDLTASLPNLTNFTDRDLGFFGNQMPNTSVNTIRAAAPLTGQQGVSDQGLVSPTQRRRNNARFTSPSGVSIIEND